jgi:antitoxin component YwqK of YwqJK toxin-antitoxin module
MKFAVCNLRFGACLLFLSALGIALITSPARAQSKRSGASDSAQQQTIKIEPYKGPPIYLPEAEVIAKPKVVSRETIPEKYEDGKPRIEREVAHYSDNNFAADGKYREFHPNGKPFIEGQFAEGRQVGEWTYYFDNGQINRKATFKDGKLDGKWDVLREDGTLAGKRSFKDGKRDGDWITYDPTGKQPISEEHYANGEEDGEWKTWYPNGQLRQQVTFKAGKREGMGGEWDDKGNKLVEANYKNGKFDGQATRYFADGKKIVQVYKDGRLESEAKQ